MTYDNLAEGGLDYCACRYGTSKLLFRGPQRRLDPPFVAVIGGTETYGKFVEKPFAALVETSVGMPVVNFGAVNAGVDIFSTDETVLSACSRAEVAIVQIMGAHNLRNRYYSVHQRRNDRFLRASRLLRMLYPEVDFTDFHFTRHLIQTLHDVDAERFGAVRSELQAAWLARMTSMLRGIAAPVVLLWLADRHPSEPSDLHRSSDPLFVTDAMLEELRMQVEAIVEATPSASAREAGRFGMVFSGLEAPAAAEVPNAAVHEEAARALVLGLAGLV